MVLQYALSLYLFLSISLSQYLFLSLSSVVGVHGGGQRRPAHGWRRRPAGSCSAAARRRRTAAAAAAPPPPGYCCWLLVVVATDGGLGRHGTAVAAPAFAFVLRPRRCRCHCGPGRQVVVLQDACCCLPNRSAADMNGARRESVHFACACLLVGLFFQGESQSHAVHLSTTCARPSKHALSSTSAQARRLQGNQRACVCANDCGGRVVGA